MNSPSRLPTSSLPMNLTSPPTGIRTHLTTSKNKSTHVCTSLPGGVAPVYSLVRAALPTYPSIKSVRSSTPLFAPASVAIIAASMVPIYSVVLVLATIAVLLILILPMALLVAASVLASASEASASAYGGYAE